MRRNSFLLKTCVLFLLLIGDSQACPWGPLSRDFAHPLDDIPVTVPFVGHAVVLAKRTDLLQMRVTKSVRGFEVGDELLLRYELSSCSRNSEAIIGSTYFVAGEYNGAVFFGYRNRDVVLRDATLRQLEACVKNGCDPQRRVRLERIVEKYEAVLEYKSNSK